MLPFLRITTATYSNSRPSRVDDKSPRSHSQWADISLSIGITMNPPRKKQKCDVFINGFIEGHRDDHTPHVSGSTSRKTSSSSSFSKALHTHEVHRWDVGLDGAVVRTRSSAVVPPPIASQIASVGLQCNWYTSLFEKLQPATLEKIFSTSDDIDLPTRYDPVTDKQVVTSLTRTRVSLASIILSQASHQPHKS